MNVSSRTRETPIPSRNPCPKPGGASSTAWIPALILLVIHALVDSTAALDIRGPDADASQFRVTSFVTGLDYPIGMETAPDGSLLVLVNAGSSFFSASGQILRFRDVDLDGMAEGPGEILYSGLPPAQTCLRKAGSLLLVGGTGGGRLVSILRMQSDRGLPLQA